VQNSLKDLEELDLISIFKHYLKRNMEKGKESPVDVVIGKVKVINTVLDDKGFLSEKHMHIEAI
jgi:hypothetical protein